MIDERYLAAADSIRIRARWAPVTDYTQYRMSPERDIWGLYGQLVGSQDVAMPRNLQYPNRRIDTK